MTKRFPLQSKGFNPFCELIGLDFSAFGEGHSRCVLTVDERLMNPHKVLHGAVVYAMADTGMGGALYPSLESEEMCATIEIKISYIRAVTVGTLTCDSKLIERRRKVAFLESEITNDGRLVALATGTFSIF